MAWSTLRMKCPHCGSYAGHEVIHTDPKHYRWSNESTTLFKRLFKQDVSYRKRTKQCKRCQKTFYTSELSQEFLGQMITTMLKWDNWHKEDTAEIEELKKVVAEKDSQLKAIRKITLKKK